MVDWLRVNAGKSNHRGIETAGNVESMQPKEDLAYRYFSRLFEFYDLDTFFLPMLRRHRDISAIGARSASSMMLRRTASGTLDALERKPASHGRL